MFNSPQPGRACPAAGQGRNQTLACGRAGRKKLFVSGFYESPESKTKSLNPGDSANPNTTIKIFVFCIASFFKRLISV
jgi:hypothetical protein